jgi:hypothetical protein
LQGKRHIQQLTTESPDKKRRGHSTKNHEKNRKGKIHRRDTENAEKDKNVGKKTENKSAYSRKGAKSAEKSCGQKQKETRPF